MSQPTLSSTASPPPTKIGVLLFPGFQLLDVAGPLDVLNILSRQHASLSLSIIAASLNPISTHQDTYSAFSNIPSNPRFSQSIVPTHTFETAPEDLEVLILPGGFGSRSEENVEGLVEFLRGYGKKLKWLLTVCTGSAILAKSGLLDGRRATSNKRAFGWVKQQNTSVTWIAKARWVVDGPIWTSSGIAAGIDMIYAWIGSIWGEETADVIADSSEYERNRDSEADRFAERWGAV
ncbi:class I glutamine amidotransferase-like protein [Amniculicola lignicola CBS 123094]|uniref:Class I glutamine amidotransferase-like protein n=1 Tax=Amniculicola lignicola CBS 123094 TaxID=1392246 RepID=A0A6A5WTK5_9PLEO|nr:class I glutamine amidotransferase-like protein [Amniculicola lignicola CBS 123094]